MYMRFLGGGVGHHGTGVGVEASHTRTTRTRPLTKARTQTAGPLPSSDSDTGLSDAANSTGDEVDDPPPPLPSPQICAGDESDVVSYADPDENTAADSGERSKDAVGADESNPTPAAVGPTDSDAEMEDDDEEPDEEAEMEWGDIYGLAPDMDDYGPDDHDDDISDGYEGYARL